MKPKIIPENARRFSLAIPPGFGIDPQTGALLNVSLITGNREAKGHGFYIDDKTLATANECVQEAGGRLKSYVTHNHGGPNSWASPDMDDASSELNIPGYFQDIAIQSSQLVAGRFEFFNAFKKNYAPQYEQLMEMAQKTPDLIGLSIEIDGYLVYVDQAGNEYGGEPEDTELIYDGMPALRVTALTAAAFVSDPAANDGLFAKLSRVFGGKQAQSRELYKALATAFHSLGSEENPAAPDLVYSDALKQRQSDQSKISTMKIIADLKTKYGKDEKKFAQAMLIVGNKPDITMEALEVEMVQADLASTTAQVSTLTADLSAAKASVATLITERDTARTEAADLKARLQKAKESGFGGVDTGAPSTGAGIGEENPFMTSNLSAQARLAKADPVRAKALEESAKAAKAAGRK